MQNKAKIMEIAAGKKAKIAGKYEVRNNAKQRYCKDNGNSVARKVQNHAENGKSKTKV